MAGPQLSELEREMAIALHNGDRDGCVAMVRRAELVLPISQEAFDGTAPPTWVSTAGPDGEILVLAFTSVELMQEASGGVLQVGRRSSLAHMCSGWPDNRWSLVINPGTPLQMVLESGFMARLACPDLAMQPHATPELPIPIVQKALRPLDALTLLRDGEPRVSGFVHKSVDSAAHCESPMALLEALGLHDAPAYLTDDGSVHLLRWLAVGNDAYRVPIGGRDAEQAAASGGWVIEPPPFVGLGMAPHPDSMIAEYKVSGVLLPHGAEIGVLTADGQYRKAAVLDADRGRWLAVQRAEDGLEVTPQMREAFEDERAEILVRLIEEDGEHA